MGALRNVAIGMGTVGELFQFLRLRKLWRMIPFVIALPIVAALLLVGRATGVAPFIDAPF